MAPSQLATEALALPRAERAELAWKLLQSLDDDGTLEEPGEVANAWAAEIDRRIEAREAGQSRSIPLATAIADVKAQLAAARTRAR